ncbi:MAG: hypothetical protein K2H86_00520 [Muribaculaceae bacterium]|nr:hypothetical protein [Muribaculaceae bacterium]
MKLFTKALCMVAACVAPFGASGATVAFEDAFKMYAPATSEFTIEKSLTVSGMRYGMACIGLTGAKGVALDRESQSKVQLYYEGTLLAEVGAQENEDGGIMSLGAGMFEDYVDPIEWETATLWMIMFDGSASAEYKREGSYTVKFEEGLFTLDGEPVAAAELNYKLVSGSALPTTYTYTLTPESGTEFGEKITGPIELTINGATRIDYNKYPARLYDPEGNQVNLQYTPKIQGNKLIWNLDEFPSKPVEWVNGDYTFRVEKNTIWVNLGFWDDGFDANFPTEDIVVTYVLKDMSSAVAVVGIEAADSYTVYTTDGKTVAVNATSDVLSELPAGLYIINGKKARICK